LKKVDILGVGIDTYEEKRVIQLLGEMVRSGDTHTVFPINPEMVMTAQSNKHFRDVLNSANLNLADGIGITWAIRFLGHKIKNRVPGVDLVEKLALAAAKNGWRIFFLGAGEGIAKVAAEKLRRRNKDLCIAGTLSGSPNPENDDSICESICKSQPDILLVAYGAPNQELWISRNQPRLRIPVAIAVGGTFDFLAGVTPRAPLLIRRIGMEWFYRLIRQPTRWRRMLKLPQFVIAVLKYRLQKSDDSDNPKIRTTSCTENLLSDQIDKS